MGSLSDAGKRMEEKGTKGLFTRKAKAAGKTVAEFAKEKKHAGGKLGKEAVFAANAQKHFHKS
jgi:hypothetical protein